MDRFFRLTWIIPVFCLLTAGCGGRSAEPPPAPQSPRTTPVAGEKATPPGAGTPQRHPNGYLLTAQPKLPTLKLWIGAHELTAELAVNATQIATGMMHRTEMAEEEGMLFVFPRPHRAAFYMRNTLIPLSCAYIDPDGVIREIHDMKPRDETPIEAATDEIQYVLETRQGWFERHGIKPGMVARTERGTFGQTFFRQPR